MVIFSKATQLVGHRGNGLADRDYFSFPFLFSLSLSLLAPGEDSDHLAVSLISPLLSVALLVSIIALITFLAVCGVQQ